MPDARPWYPPAGRDAPGIDAGAMTGGAPKIVLHSTEGTSYPGAVAAFRANNSWPHGTIDEHAAPHQHLPYDVAARSLRHPFGAGATNTDNVVQLEIVGFAHQAAAWPDRLLVAIGQWVADIAEQTGAALAAPYPFVAPPRLDWPAWHAATGVLGHCHVPGNDHVDPGPLNIARVLAVARGDNPPMPPPPSNMARLVHRRAGGRWKLAADGGIFADLGAPFYGSLGGRPLNAPAVALVPTRTELGYWIVAADGGIFASVDGQPFGDARGILPYAPLVDEYRLGVRHVIDAALGFDGDSLDLLSNLGEDYHLG